MNVLLFAPGLLLLLLQSQPNLTGTLICLSICASVQLILGAPFLLTYPVSYLRKAFELDRVFFYKWTVNWKFLPEDVFVSKPLSILLLLLHLGCLACFAIKWLSAAKSQTGRYINIPSPNTRIRHPNHVRIELHRDMFLEDVALPILLLVLSHAPLPDVDDGCTVDDANSVSWDGRVCV